MVWILKPDPRGWVLVDRRNLVSDGKSGLGDDLIGALFIAFWAGVFGAWMGMFVLWGNGDTPFLKATISGALVCGGAAFIVAMVYGAFKRGEESEKAAAAERKQRDLAASREIERQRSAREAARRGALHAANQAVEEIEKLPAQLENARGWSSEADRFYSDGAFSPFWSAIENAYSNLGACHDSLGRIQDASTRHSAAVHALIMSAGDPGVLSDFPVHIDRGRIESILSAVTAELGQKAYEAQRNPVFAQIWEQRRTTAAVIAGFANLEQAIYGMQARLAQSIASLDATLKESGEGVRGQLSQIARNAETASSQQIAEFRSLNSRSEKIYQEVHHLSWGKYPMS